MCDPIIDEEFTPEMIDEALGIFSPPESVEYCCVNCGRIANADDSECADCGAHIVDVPAYE